MPARDFCRRGKLEGPGRRRSWFYVVRHVRQLDPLKVRWCTRGSGPFRSPPFPPHSAQPNLEHLTLWLPIPRCPCPTPSSSCSDTNVVLFLWMFEILPWSAYGRLSRWRPAPLHPGGTAWANWLVPAFTAVWQPEERQLAIASAYRARCTLIDATRRCSRTAPLPGPRRLEEVRGRPRQRVPRPCSAATSFPSSLSGCRPVIAAFRYAILTPERLQALLADRLPRATSSFTDAVIFRAKVPALDWSSFPGACHGHRYEFPTSPTRHHLPDPPRPETSRRSPCGTSAAGRST